MTEEMTYQNILTSVEGRVGIVQLNCPKVLNALKVLGLHSRYSLSVSKYQGKVNSLRDALFLVVADINKLPIVTFDNNRYINTSLKIIHPQDLRG